MPVQSLSPCFSMRQNFYLNYHYIIPWLHALVDDSKTALVMTFHPYKRNVAVSGWRVDEHQWKQVLPGCTSVLGYLQTKINITY